MANLDYSIIITMLTNVMIVSFPIALMFMIVSKIVNMFTSFIFGRKVDL